MPWSGLAALIEPHYPKAGGGCKSYQFKTMLRIHLLQNWFSLSNPAMGDTSYEITSMRQFARLTLSAPIPENTTILNFRHLLEKHRWRQASWKPSMPTGKIRGCRCDGAPLWMPRSSMRPVRPKTMKTSAIQRRIRQKRQSVLCVKSTGQKTCNAVLKMEVGLPKSACRSSVERLDS